MKSTRHCIHLTMYIGANWKLLYSPVTFRAVMWLFMSRNIGIFLLFFLFPSFCTTFFWFCFVWFFCYSFCDGKFPASRLIKCAHNAQARVRVGVCFPAQTLISFQLFPMHDFALANVLGSSDYFLCSPHLPFSGQIAIFPPFSKCIAVRAKFTMAQKGTFATPKKIVHTANNENKKNVNGIKFQIGFGW